jgi:hypothetical protein
VRRLEEHEHDVHDIRRAEDDPSCWPAPFKRNEFPAPHSRALVEQGYLEIKSRRVSLPITPFFPAEIR